VHDFKRRTRGFEVDMSKIMSLLMVLQDKMSNCYCFFDNLGKDPQKLERTGLYDNFNTPLILVSEIIHICEDLNVITLIFFSIGFFSLQHSFQPYYHLPTMKASIFVAAVCAAISPLASAVCDNNLIRCFIDTATLATPYCSSFLLISPVTVTKIVAPVK
jgi:hypothetical protein